MQRGSDISVSFSNGDRFGAVATASGLVKVYKNSTLLATVDVTAWPYYASGGYIGLWMIGASGNVLDDFGGGTIPQGSLPGGSLTAWWERVKDWIGQVSGGGKVAAPAALKSQMAIRQRELTLTDPPAGRIYRSYYFVGSVRVAMREFTGSVSVVSYILTDHLGSTSMILDSSGVGIVSMGYKPWGELRYPQQNPEFGYKFTGQMQLDIGIYHYGARQYDPLTGRFLQADTIVPQPGNPMAWDRYAGMFNNPIRYIDLFGHNPCDGSTGGDPECSSEFVEIDTQPELTPWGKKMQEFLKRIQVTPGWWNNYANGWTDDVTTNMTPIQLLKLMLSYEFKTLPKLDYFLRKIPDALENIAHASAHSAYGLCEAMSSGSFCSSMSSPNAILNYVGSLQVARERSTGIIGSVLKNDGNISVADYVVGMIMSPTDLEWRNGGSGKSLMTRINSDHPLSWGNGSLFTITPTKFLWRYGSDGQDIFYILSVSYTNELQQFKR